MDKQFYLTLYQTYGYLSMLGLKLNHDSNRAPGPNLNRKAVFPGVELPL